MNPLNSLLNHVGSLPTKAVQASAHRFHLDFSRLGERDVATEPAKFLIGNPSLFSSRRSNPYLGFATAMSDRQRPLGGEFDYIGVRNHDSAQRIHNFNVVSVENHFRSNPDQVSSNGQNQANRKINEVLLGACCNHHTVHSKEKNQRKRHTRPKKVTAGSKGFIHILSIAGETK